MDEVKNNPIKAYFVKTERGKSKVCARQLIACGSRSNEEP